MGVGGDGESSGSTAWRACVSDTIGVASSARAGSDARPEAPPQAVRSEVRSKEAAARGPDSISGLSVQEQVPMRMRAMVFEAHCRSIAFPRELPWQHSSERAAQAPGLHGDFEHRL